MSACINKSNLYKYGYRYDGIVGEMCENCGQAKILCRRLYPVSDTQLVSPLYGPCQRQLQFQSTKHITDLKIWQALNQTSTNNPRHACSH